MFSLKEATKLLYLTTTLEEQLQRMRLLPENNNDAFLREKKQFLALQQQIEALCKQQIAA